MAKYMNKMELSHYFASSVAEWRTGNDLEKLIKLFKKEDFPFKVWFVPLNENAGYKIESYAPLVEGRVLIANYRKEK